MEYTINQPLYETDEGVVIGIYDRRIHEAIKRKEFFKAISFWRGIKVSKVFQPKWIKRNCKKIEKVYLRPNQPMTEYELFIPKPPTEKEKLIKFCKENY